MIATQYFDVNPACPLADVTDVTRRSSWWLWGWGVHGGGAWREGGGLARGGIREESIKW